jgi:hypothetical protein
MTQRLCRRRHHDLNVVGVTSSGGCRGCKQIADRDRAKRKREEKRTGVKATKFNAGEGYIATTRFGQLRFGWEEVAFLHPERLLALCRWYTRPRVETPWRDFAAHSLYWVGDRGMDVWKYQETYFPHKGADYYFASDSMMNDPMWRNEQGDGYRFEDGRFAWKTSKFPGVLGAIMETGWSPWANHALMYIEDEGQSPASYLDDYYPDEEDGYRYASQETMETIFNFAEWDAKQDELEGASS